MKIKVYDGWPNGDNLAIAELVEAKPNIAGEARQLCKCCVFSNISVIRQACCKASFTPDALRYGAPRQLDASGVNEHLVCTNQCNLIYVT